MWKNIEKYLIINKLRYDFFSFPLLILLLSFHTARHSFATVLKRAGAKTSYISESLGHSNLAVTENYLAYFEKEERIRNAQLLTNFNL